MVIDRKQGGCTLQDQAADTSLLCELNVFSSETQALKKNTHTWLLPFLFPSILHVLSGPGLTYVDVSLANVHFSLTSNLYTRGDD